MDISGISMSLKSIQTNNEVGIALLSKALDNNEEQGAQLVNMIDKAAMERSVNPNIGSNFDASV